MNLANFIFFILICEFFMVSSLKLNLSTRIAESSNFIKDESLILTKTIRFKNSRPRELDENRCTFLKLNQFEKAFITEIDPIADKNVAHHMTLFGCEELPEFEFSYDTNTWDCSSGLSGIGYSRRLFTWALNAKGVKYPPGVGVRVGRDSRLNYLIVQVHYNKLVNQADNLSSYKITLTTQDLPYQVGVYNIGNNGFIPPKRKDFKFEASCVHKKSYDMVPIFYRTHAHSIIDVMSIYLLKKNQLEWIELGRMSPHQPQMFYPVTNKDMIVENGDIIAARCTINSMERNSVTRTGPRHEDEMCAFYLMFYTDYKGLLVDEYCYKDGNRYKWAKKIPTDPPENASNLDGVILIEPENEPKHNKHHKHHKHQNHQM